METLLECVNLDFFMKMVLELKRTKKKLLNYVNFFFFYHYYFIIYIFTFSDEKSSFGGNHNAMHNLGMMYYNGKSVDINYQKSLELFKKASDEGNYDSMNQVHKNNHKKFYIKIDFFYFVDWFHVCQWNRSLAKL